MRILVVILFLVAAKSLVASAWGAGGKLYIGDGSNSCGAWTEERARDNQRVQLWKGWLLDFVSGANIYGNSDILAGADAQAIYGWVDNYCRAHPLDRVFDGAVALVSELLRRAEHR